MRKAFLGLLLVSVAAFALDDMTVPNNYTSNQILTAAQLNEDNDSTYLPYNRMLDSLDAKFIRFTDLSDGDSTLDTLKVSAIRGNPDVDSLNGKIVVDSLEAGVSGGIVIDSAAIGYCDPDTIAAFSLSGKLTAGANEVEGSSFDVNGGAIDGAIIGAASAAAGTFTSVSSSGPLTGTTLNTGQGANELYDMDQNVLTTSNVEFNKVTTDSLVQGFVNCDSVATDLLRFPYQQELTLSSDTVTLGEYRWIGIDTEGDAALDTLSTIVGGTSGDILILQSKNNLRDIFIDDGAGNIQLSGDFTMDTYYDIVVLMKFSSYWIQIAQNNNS